MEPTDKNKGAKTKKQEYETIMNCMKWWMSWSHVLENDIEQTFKGRTEKKIVLCNWNNYESTVG